MEVKVDSPLPILLGYGYTVVCICIAMFWENDNAPGA